MHWLKRTYDWLEFRLKLEGPIKETVLHPVPRNTASWWYVFGSASFELLLLQIATGILLAIVYVPSAGEAWNSLDLLNHHLTLGWFLRAMHGWGSNFMVAVVLIHMAQVFLFGAYKFPRELTWILGVFLLLMTLGMAFTGQVLRFDQDAYWGLGIGVAIVGRVPILGASLVHLLLGGPIIAGDTLSRFFALHVFVIPGLLIGFRSGRHRWPRSDSRSQPRASAAGRSHYRRRYALAILRAARVRDPWPAHRVPIWSPSLAAFRFSEPASCICCWAVPLSPAIRSRDSSRCTCS